MWTLGLVQHARKTAAARHEQNLSSHATTRLILI
jgi:hypothetical protein